MMKKKGLTLIELIIVVALISFISMGVYILTGFSNKTYKTGAEQYDVQSDQRLISDVISDNLKYAYNIEILDDINSEGSVEITDSSNPLYGYNYIYLQYNDKNANGICDDDEGIAIKKIMFDPSTKTYSSSIISSTSISNLVYNLVFSYSGGSEIKFDLTTSKDNKEEFNLTTKVNIMNAHLGSLPVIPVGSTEKIGKAIRFKLDPTTVSSVVVPNYPPTANNVQITGTATVGATLHGNYLYSDIENDAESGTLLIWESKYASEPETEWTEIPGATGIDYTLTISEFNKVIRLVVVPYAATGASPGEASASSPTDVVTGTGISKPSASELSIESNLKKGKSNNNDYKDGCILTANYSFSTTNIKDDNSIITWYKVTDDKNATVTELQKGPQQTYRIYTTQPGDIGYNIYFTVEPIDGSGIHGDIQQISAIGPIY